MEKYSQELESKEVALGTNDCLCLSVREVVGLYCTKDLKLKLLSRGIGMNLLFGLDASSLIRLNSATVSLSLLSFNETSVSFGSPRILILLSWMFSISSDKYLGKPPQIGAAYSNSGRIFVS